MHSARSVLLFVLCCFCISTPSSLIARTIFVDAAVPDSGSGLDNWSQAKKTIPEAIDIALPGDEIWVAEGIYTDSIRLTTGVAVFGGFNKTEIDAADRNLENHSSIIDFKTTSTLTSDTYVIQMSKIVNARLDGFILKGKTTADYGIFFVCNFQDDSCVVANCELLSDGYRRGLSINRASPTIINCKISGFIEDGIFSARISESEPKLMNCIISNNGLRGINMSVPYTMKNCMVINNERIGIVCFYGTPTIQNCLISGNLHGIQMSGDGTIENCRIIGNELYGLANGSVAPDDRIFLNSTIKNCIISGNGRHGVSDWRSNSVYINCTISDNQLYGLEARPQDPDTIIYTDHGPTLTNCIITNNRIGVSEGHRRIKVRTQNCLYYNEVAEYSVGRGLHTVQEMIEILDERTTAPIVQDPLFRISIPQTWTTTPTIAIEAGTSHTLLTNALADYSPNELVGKIINPSLNQKTQTFVISNTATSIRVNGDFSKRVQNGDEYMLIDYRLQPGSPAIDVGSATTKGLSYDFNGHPRPVDIVNAGAEATGTEYDIGAFEFGALQAWIRDYILASANFSPPDDLLATFDLNEDGMIDVSDIAASLK